MQFTVTFATLFAGLVAAVPSAAVLEDRQTTLCTGLYGNEVCCATDVLQLASLDCAPPPTVPANATDFQDICAAIGQQALCCAVPVLGQALLCETPQGVE